MARKRIKMSLSQNSINDVIKQIQDYRNSLDKKVREFVSSLQQIGIQVITVTLGSVSDEDRGRIFGVYYPTPSGSDGTYTAEIQMYGDQVLFLEFSAGETFGKAPGSFESLPNNPDYGAEYGYGTYPSDKGHWNDPEGWWYRNGSGEPVHTWGVPAYQPMYKADVAMRKIIEHEAKVYFGWGK